MKSRLTNGLRQIFGPARFASWPRPLSLNVNWTRSMMATQVKAIVLSEIGDQWHRTNLHHVSLRECLVEPEYLKFIDVTTGQPFHAWLVLRCSPGNGYGIVYDECSANFGLAQFADGYEPCLIGLYGDFFTTLDAM